MTNKLLYPTPFLSSLIGQPIVVRLKWGMEYVGLLVSFDERTNIHLRECEEWISGNKEGQMGDILIRCNNILHIRPKPSIYPPEIIQPISEIVLDENY